MRRAGIVGAVLILAALAGCAGRHVAKFPSGACSMAQIYVAPGCYKREFPDRVEIHCAAGVTTYKCAGVSQ